MVHGVLVKSASVNYKYVHVGGQCNILIFCCYFQVPLCLLFRNPWENVAYVEATCTIKALLLRRYWFQKTALATRNVVKLVTPLLIAMLMLKNGMLWPLTQRHACCLSRTCHPNDKQHSHLHILEHTKCQTRYIIVLLYVDCPDC